MHINPRSVLRPEYLEQSSECTRNIEHPSLKRLNTNTAPVYMSGNLAQLRKRQIYRRQAHPYTKYSKGGANKSNSSSSSSLANSWYQPGLRRRDSNFHVRSDTSDSEETFNDHSTSPSLSQASKNSSDCTIHSLSKAESSRISSTNGLNDLMSQTKSYSHGQAEQLRRSRESTTFALIDAQLSVPPLNQVREMYLQNRNGCYAGSNASAARTTKKANLSVVHTLVRFRIKEYLIELREHIHKLLDILFSNIVENYDGKSRDALASELLGLSTAPCSTDCQYCPRLFRRGDRSRSRYNDSYSRAPQFHHSQSRDNTIIPTLKDELVGSFGHTDLNSHFIVDTNVPIESNCPSLTLPLKREFDYDQQIPPVPALEFEISDESECLQHSALQNPCLEKPLLSFHISPETKLNKRLRLDSTTLRLANDFDPVDWSAEDIDIGPLGDDFVDLHNLVTDSNPDSLSFKYDDTLFDTTYDFGDLMHQFTFDKHPSSQLAVSP